MGLGVVAIADPPTAIRLKVPFSDGLGGGDYQRITFNQRILKKKIMMAIGEAIIHDGFPINESEDQGTDLGCQVC